ncbi:MAG: hypothetical protein M3Z14_03405 [Candidatus Eremiobacteraeota bacterium]|nr:hypothetical protein [Candidatus Eremiobacteraeota bacterium]
MGLIVGTDDGPTLGDVESADEGGFMSEVPRPGWTGRVSGLDDSPLPQPTIAETKPTAAIRWRRGTVIHLIDTKLALGAARGGRPKAIAA